ncbi:hypothetical protein Vi05172_g12346 [Venturia inaequalis]|nr:hypothetical protein Vi05172_g12346 [Venturia inaequalis]
MENAPEKFPAFAPDAAHSLYEESAYRNDSPARDVRISVDGDRWQPRRSSRAQRPNLNGAPLHSQAGPSRHGRQKSLGEAIRTIRTRSASVTQNAHEIADALKAPVSPRLVILCSVWYGTSMLANTSAGQILKTFPKPVTLTIIQFAFVTSWCLFLSWLSKVYPSLKNHIPALRNGIRPPSRELIQTTLPLTGFMIGGHILTSDAMSRIPVSLVHTIKGLSPLFTVFAYRVFLKTRHSYATYLSLIPLTAGVILACSTQFSTNFLGLFSALCSAMLFVTQNIVSKQMFNDAAAAEHDSGQMKASKPDKLNLLCYSSALALCVTAPIWLWSEGFTIIGDLLHDASIDLAGKPGTLDHGRLALEYVFNGTFHFAQSLVAFTLLSMVSPVTYSVASLIKRVFVILFAIVWFGNQVTGVQGMGIALTFLGLYLYDRTSDASKAERKARLLQKHATPLLPLHEKPFESPVFEHSPGLSHSPAFDGGVEKRHDAAGPGGTSNGWLPPGTKAQDTWSSNDVRGQPVPVT